MVDAWVTLVECVMNVKFLRNNLTRKQATKFYTFVMQEFSDRSTLTNSATPQ